MSGKVIFRNSILFFILSFFVFLNIACSSGMRLPDKLKIDQSRITKMGLDKGINYSVILAGVSLPEDLPADQAEARNPLQIDNKQFADELVKTFRAANVFKTLEKVSDESLSKKNQLKEARDQKAGLLMDVNIKKARLYFAGKNSAVLGNTALWLLCGLPSFWGADCDYGVDMEAEVSFLDVASDPEFAMPAGTYNCPFSEKGSLNFLQRSFSPAIFIMPPQWCPDNFDRIGNLISADAQKKFIIQLADMLKTKFETK
jgi:hypothetical protein